MLKVFSPTLCAFLVFFAGTQTSHAAEGDALTILANIQARHLPYGGILDPIFTVTNSDQIATYTRCGDSALWTGEYLAAEAFRYKVTQAADALANITSAVAAIKGLADVTGTNLLARCMVPSDSPYAESISSQESANGVHKNSSAGWIWVGNTSRDEYSGVMFGLSVAFDMVNDDGIQSSISQLVTRLVDFLNDNNWSVVMPDTSSSTTFLVRPDQVEAFLAIGRQVNPDHFSSVAYETQRDLLSVSVPLPISIDILGNDSYFKFNLDYLNLYNLVRLESSSAKSIYQAAYSQLRGYTTSHQNAFFNIVDLALNGPDATRDGQTLGLLDGWLLRLRRDFPVDLTNTVQVCGSQACQPVPVWERPNTDYLWQRSPFALTNGGNGLIESAGIDYVLPYWMARYYGLQDTTGVSSAAAPVSVAAPASLGSIYGATLAPTVQQSAPVAFAASLGGVSISITDAAGNTAVASPFYVSPGQINFVMPTGLVPGVATFTVTDGGNPPVTAIGAIGAVAPALFTMLPGGAGFVAATAIRADQTQIPLYNCANSSCQPLPIDLSNGPVYLSLYGTGIRNASSLSNVLVTVNGISQPVLYAGPQPTYAGEDQINIELTPDLAGSGVTNLVLKVDQHQANTVTVDIQ